MRRAAPIAFVLSVALLARLVTWTEVFGAGAVRLLGDSDPHYHVLRAQRWLAGAPGAPWRDPWLRWPGGADVVWPPLFDGLIAALARAVFGPSPARDQVAAAAAFLPVALGVALVALVARLSRRIRGEGSGWIAAAFVAVLPAATVQSLLGRPDQHALEVVLLTGMLLASLPAARGARPAIGPAIALALLVPASFWNWPGSALALAVLAAVGAGLHLFSSGATARDATDRSLGALAVGAGAGALLLALTVGALGEAGALTRFAVAGVGGLHVVIAGGTGGWAWLLLRLRRRRADAGRWRRLGELAIATAIPGALLLLPTLRAGVGDGLARLAASTPWHAEIQEFAPLLEPGGAPLGGQLLAIAGGFGLLLPMAGLSLLPGAGAGRPLRERPERIALLMALLILTGAALLRRRFALYAIVPLAVAAEDALTRGAAWLAARRPGLSRTAIRGALLAAVVATVAPSFPEHLALHPAIAPDHEAALRWLAERPAPGGREGVLAPWSLGHLVQYFAARPVLTSPFGTDLGADAFDEAAAFWLSADGTEAEAVLARSHCGTLLLTMVPEETFLLHRYAPAGTPPPLLLRRDADGEGFADTETFWRLVPVRLYYGDGRGGPLLPPLDGFRLVHETPATSPDNPAEERQARIFEHVPGAAVAARAAADALVRATVQVRTATGRGFTWTTEARAGVDGVARLRLPYATGMNGSTHAVPWTLESSGRSVTLVVAEGDVVEGRSREVVFGEGTAR